MAQHRHLPRLRHGQPSPRPSHCASPSPDRSPKLKPQPSDPDVQADAVPEPEYREEKSSPRAYRDMGRYRLESPMVSTDDYGTFSPLSSPTYGKTASGWVLGPSPLPLPDAKGVWPGVTHGCWATKLGPFLED